jgi:long-subunit acyl-CoA synthetase (AMP-forming)
MERQVSAPALAPGAPASEAALRVMDVLDRTAARHPDLPALKWKREGHWLSMSWAEYRARIRRAARSLMQLGVGPGDCITIIGFNRPEWFIADVGAIYAGAIPAGIYTTSTDEQCAFIAAHCAARVAFVENRDQLRKFLDMRDRLPKLESLVLMEGAPPPDERAVYSWDAFLKLADAIPDRALDARAAAQRPDDVCTLIYTSGTTGIPKAVMLTHDNITWTARVAGEQLHITAGDDAISYLPLSHIAEQITTLFGAMMHGVCVWFAESLEKLGENLREVRPLYFLAAPRVWEKMQERMQAVAAKNSAAKRRIARWARGVGLAGGYAQQAKTTRPILYPVADKLVFSKVRAALGLDRARVLVTSTAPISRDTLEFFLSLGMPICEVYGMSECTGPATVSHPDDYRTGKVGKSLPGAELKVAEDGEICMRGRHVFKGYFKDPAATSETIDNEGWLHSGDVGVLDADGYLQITDRKKELIITSGGENIAPQLVESFIKSIPVVSQAVVVGDRQRFLTALLTLDREKVPAAAREAGCDGCDFASVIRDQRFVAYLQRELDRVNTRLARVQTVKKFAVIDGEFTVEGGELTPTLKIRRKAIMEKYSSEIARLYE